MPRQSSPDLAYYRERLAEPELLKTAVLIDGKLAVPVGKLRHGGDLDFTSKRKAMKALKLLKGHPAGFPALRIATMSVPLAHPVKKRGGIYTLKWGGWGGPAQFDDYSEPQRWGLQRIYYGYRAEAIVDSFTNLLGHPLKRKDRAKLLRGIKMIRNGSLK
jgi:hypothetical protein